MRARLVIISWVFTILTFAFVAGIIFAALNSKRRRDFIETYSWPPHVMAALATAYPHLRSRDRDDVGRGL
jgi:hypothetical protein